MANMEMTYPFLLKHRTPDARYLLTLHAQTAHITHGRGCVTSDLQGRVYVDDNTTNTNSDPFTNRGIAGSVGFICS